jgi:phosphoenolpyruvate---glycerone phosphotransferase subunit DhaM
MNSNVAIVIVSHSSLVAQGAADMALQMVGDEVRVVPCGGDKDGGLGTDVARIQQAILDAYTEKGVLIIVDLGGAETNAEMAIELLPESMRPHVLLSDAAIVEGTLMAATEASSGASLLQVKAVAEDYN